MCTGCILAAPRRLDPAGPTDPGSARGGPAHRFIARCSENFVQRSYELAQTEPNSEVHQLALLMVGISGKLPRNNLRLIVRPIALRREWFNEAYKRFRVAEAERKLIGSRWSLAYLLNGQDGGTRSDALQVARREADEKVTRAIEDALRVRLPASTMCAASRIWWVSGIGRFVIVPTGRPWLMRIWPDTLHGQAIPVSW